MPTDKGHAVDGAGSAQCLALRPIQDTPVQLRFGLAFETPVVAWIYEQPSHASRHANPETVRRRSSLDRQDLNARILTQPGRQHTTGRPPACDHIIELFVKGSHCRDQNIVLSFNGFSTTGVPTSQCST